MGSSPTKTITEFNSNIDLILLDQYWKYLKFLLYIQLNMLQLFVVFHKKIFDECYSEIPADILSKYFTFVAVNTTIPKEYTPNKYKIINEWELPIYDNSFQEKGFKENSVLYHVYANNLHIPYKYIGFMQYDMHINMNFINDLLQNISDTPTCFAYSLHNFVFCSYQTWYEPALLEFIIKDYEQFYNKKFNRSLIYPLYNTYVLPSVDFEIVMEWVTQLYDKLNKIFNMRGYEHNLINCGGVYERIMAYVIGNLNLPYKLLKDVDHDHVLKQQVY